MVLTIDLVLEELTSLVDPNIPEIHFYGNENTPNWRRKELASLLIPVGDHPNTLQAIWLLPGNDAKFLFMLVEHHFCRQYA